MLDAVFLENGKHAWSTFMSANDIILCKSAVKFYPAWFSYLFETMFHYIPISSIKLFKTVILLYLYHSMMFLNWN